MNNDRAQVRQACRDYERRLAGVQNIAELFSAWDAYCTTLLPLEMAQIRERSTRPAKNFTTLVLLVGYSLEPLLQTLCFYQTERVILILSKQYGGLPGHDMAARVKTSVSQLRTGTLIEKTPEVTHEIVDETGPEAVYRCLLSTLQTEQPEDVVIDITGAQKSMVAGAFFYAAFARTAISYVDFDTTTYNIVGSRPVGFKSKIRTLDNPYEIFALREWGQVRTLYLSYQFREARDLLKSVRDALQCYQPDALPAIDKLSAVLDGYHFWDAGNFEEAHKVFSQLEKFIPPSAVSELGNNWFKATGVTVTPRHRFFADTRELHVYVRDELDRLKRLIDYSQDYRSAFLRAGGVNEVLLASRLTRLVEGPDQQQLLDALDIRTPRASWVFEQLMKPAGQQFTVSNRKYPKSFSMQSPKMSRWWNETAFTGDGWEQFLNLRNKVTHTHISITEELARAGLAFAEAHFADFVASSHVSDDRPIGTESYTWAELCRWCGLVPYLTPNLLSGGGRKL